MANLMPCPHCDGDGYTVESAHHHGCDGSCRDGLCPVPVQERCSFCQGDGEFEDPCPDHTSEEGPHHAPMCHYYSEAV